MPALRIWRTANGDWAWACDDGNCALGFADTQDMAVLQADTHQAAHYTDHVHVEEPPC